MDSQMQANFLHHIINFFAVRPNDEGPGDTSTATPASGGSCPDLPSVLGLLRAAGFVVTYSDKGDRGGTSLGCRAIIVCQRSGMRVVMDGEGPCTCPSDDGLRRFLTTSSAGQPPSRAASPTPSTVGMLDNSFSGGSLAVPGAKSPAPEASAAAGSPNGEEASASISRLNRQRTWSRDDEVRDIQRAAAADAPGTPEGRRLSAPPAPLQGLGAGAWATFNGDELNVLAASDLLQEALSLLAGVKKVSLRNTPVGPTRRLSAVAGRRMSSDMFVQPLRPVSRTSSVSSGLGSTRSTASLQSQGSHGDTPRPLPVTQRPGIRTNATAAAVAVGGDQAPGAAGRTLRRTMSASAGATSRGNLAGGAAAATRTDAARKAECTTDSRSMPAPKVPPVKAPSAGAAKSSFLRTPMRIGIKTNATLSVAKAAHPKKIMTSPDVESVKL